MIHTPAGTWPEPGPDYLAPTFYLDGDHPVVRDFAERTVAGAADARSRAVRLFYAVRDGWRYDPFAIKLEPAYFVASHVLEVKGAFCIPKAILLAAAARVVGIPAGLGFSDVVNHLTSDKLRARMGGKTLFIHHGYAVLWLGDRWLKAAPAFNIELCDRFGVRPTEFDGTDHAVFQEFDARDRRHMEYVADHGMWSDFPFERIATDFRAFYPSTAFAETTDRFEDDAPSR